MIGALSLLIFFFTLIVYLSSHFLHIIFFTSDISIFLIAALPVVGIILAIWSHGFMKFFGIIGNLAVIVLASIMPIYLFYF